MSMQFIDSENIKVNSSLIDNLALSVLTGLGYYILNRISKRENNPLKKDLKDELIDNYNKLEDSKSLNLFRSYIANDEELSNELKHQEPNIDTYNKIIANILNEVKANLRFKDKKLRKIEEILSLFTELKERKFTPTLFTYNRIMEALLEKSDFQEAWKIYNELETELFEGDLFTLCSLLKIWKQARLGSTATNNSEEQAKITKIELILNSYVLKESDFEELTLNNILENLISENKFALAEKLFQTALKLKQNCLSLYTYSIMIKAYGSENNFDKASEIMQKIEEAGLKANDVIYGCLLNCAVKCSKFDYIKKIWEQMKNNSVEPNCIIYSTLIKAYNKMKLYDVALEIFEKISHEEKINSNIIIYNAVLDVCVESKNLEKLKEIYEFIKIMCNICPQFPKPNLITYSTIIKGFVKCQKMDEAMDLYETLKSQKFQLDEVLFNTLIDGYGKQGNDKMAIKLYEEMKSYGIKGSAVIFSILIKMYCNQNDMTNALHHFNLYKSENHKPSIVPYTTLIQVYIRRKELDKAIEIFEQIKKVGLKPDQVSYNFIINGCTFNRKLEKAIEYLHESFAKNMKLSDDTYNNLLEYLVNNKFMKTHERIKNISEIIKILKERKFEIHYDLYSRLMKIVYSANENKVANKKYRAS